jgi:acetyltransferase-like isoleucine patch superfamily enzyme
MIRRSDESLKQQSELLLKDQYPGHDIGEGTYGLLTVFQWDSTTKLKIGRYTSFAFGTMALLGGEHRDDWVTQYPFSILWPEGQHIEGHPKSRGNIEVGNDVWVGADAMLLSGALVGDGAVVSARTVVSGAVAPYSIVAGNPMRFVRWRFPEAQRVEMLRIKWWDWPKERIGRALPALLSSDIGKFIRLVQQGEL